MGGINLRKQRLPCGLYMFELILWILFFVVNGLLFYFVFNLRIKVYPLLPAILRSIGHLNCFSLGILILPVARNSLWMSLLHLPFERAIMYHQWLARWFFLTITVHGVGWTCEYLSKSLLNQVLYSPKNSCRFLVEEFAEQILLQQKSCLHHWTVHLGGLISDDIDGMVQSSQTQVL